MRPPAPKITIDTNCVVGLFDTKSETATSRDELRELMRYALSGVIELCVTTRVEVDFGRDKDAERRDEMMNLVAMLPVIGTIARWDVSSWDSGDVMVDEKSDQLSDEVQRIVFPGLTPKKSGKYANKVADIDHLVGHTLSGRDVFVTDDGAILRRYRELQDAIGILVMSPAECLRFVDGHYSRREAKELKPANDDAAYRDRRLKGTATFDYSNNDHRFAIGEGLYLVETRWSKASDTRIHAYRDSPSIEAIALVKDVTSIHEITDATAYDYSSRVRSAEPGQVILWRNINGLYAATRIMGIKDDSRGSAHDELTFEFVILPDGGTDFSKA
jgi:hypothetical protein